MVKIDDKLSKLLSKVSMAPGWECFYKNGHWCVVSPRGGKTFSPSTTTSPRGFKNFRAQLRRLGWVDIV
jgi:hypothetical protein